MNYSQESLERQSKIQKLKDLWINPYANAFANKMDIDKIIAQQNFPKSADELMETGAVGQFKTAWRLVSFRSHWKLSFWKILDNSEKIQICLVRWKLSYNNWKDILENIEIDWQNMDVYKFFDKMIDLWDYVGVIWDLFLTKHGELTLFVKEFQILSKAVRPLPEKFHWVKDVETIYRQRYLDLISNDASYQRLKLRSKFIKVLRDFYFENDFIEIETPVLWNAASGAAAAPFITHHNDFDEDFFLRISPETALKKATVWRFEKVVEFTRNFRNEGSDPSHIQEFSAIEHYSAYWNFEDNMKFTEDMFAYIFEKIPELKKQIQVKDKQGNTKSVDFSNKWERINYVEWVKKACGIDVSQYKPEDEDKLRKEIQQAGHSWEWIEKQATATMIDYLYKKVLRPSIVWPAFVYNYPKTMQPLARQSDENPDIVEQFQVVINGWEVIKAYSELVDPKIQSENFDAQWDALARWDEEATSWDDDFVLAMEYAMPPQSGWGMWIERIFSLLTEQENLRDVVLFPLMKGKTNALDEEEFDDTQVA